MKCFSGTNRPERPLNVHCAGWFNFSIAWSISTAFGGGAAGFGGGAVCNARLFPNCHAFLLMSNADTKRNTAAAKASTRSKLVRIHVMFKLQPKCGSPG